jgi:hypothetical protein
MKKILLIIVSTIFLFSCQNDYKEIVQTDNSDFKVQYLFEVDGCKVYRFMDDGSNRYLTTCQGLISWEEKHGKSNVNMQMSTQNIK